MAGNIAYFTSAEMPLREDLQGLRRPADVEDATRTVEVLEPR